MSVSNHWQKHQHIEISHEMDICEFNRLQEMWYSSAFNMQRYFKNPFILKAFDKLL